MDVNGNNSPTISIIMGIYNCAETLPESIESILNQTFTDWELIMCDDGSNDNTYHVAEWYASVYQNKIVLLKNEKNRGLNYTLNKCLEAVKGKYIARMFVIKSNIDNIRMF
ncbi:glycosyltransferase family 2 protein [Dorea sp. YH-dor228]|uniref:glycosyltransferase family 2 protein n=1 Tax=Dorea sp. YH-dor228 TaxID=3151120 RepID=UPI003241BAAF